MDEIEIWKAEERDAALAAMRRRAAAEKTTLAEWCAARAAMLARLGIAEVRPC